MAECKVSKEYSRNEKLFDNCCDAIFKMEWEIFKTSYSPHLFEIEAKERGFLTNKIKIQVETHETGQSNLTVTGLSKNWLTAKSVVDGFFTHLENQK